MPKTSFGKELTCKLTEIQLREVLPILCGPEQMQLKASQWEEKSNASKQNPP